MKDLIIVYKNNDATQIPVYMFGTAIQIKHWLNGQENVPFLKRVFAFNDANYEEEYDDGQGRRFDILDSELE